VPNHLLTMTERLPALLVPVLVAHLVSPEATAYWYPAWMLAWVAYTVPIQVGLVQFSEGVRRPSELRRTLRSGFVSALVLGGSAAAVLVVFAHPLLSLIGAEYADASTNALRVLTVGLVPFAVWQCYNARCRAAGLVREGIVAGLALAGAICLASVWAAPRGSTALAVAWVTVSCLGAVWAAWRLSRREQAG
jgi:Na+-driven multidrug efflux pump